MPSLTYHQPPHHLCPICQLGDAAVDLNGVGTMWKLFLGHLWRRTLGSLSELNKTEILCKSLTFRGCLSYQLVINVLINAVWEFIPISLLRLD